MGVRSRAFVLVTVASVVLWIAVASVAAIYSTHTSNETDAEETIGALGSTSAVIESELDRLVSICSDWAVWDDAYDFVREPNAEFIETNLGDDTLVLLGIDFMVFVDRSGKIVQSVAVDPVTHETTELPVGIGRYLAAQPSFLRTSNPRDTVSGALCLPSGPFLVAALPIGKTDYSAAPAGTLFTGIRVDRRIRSRIQAITLRSLSIFASTSSTLPADVRSARSTLKNPGEHIIEAADEDTNMVYGLVSGIADEQGFVVRVPVRRTDYIQARNTIFGVGIGITLLGLVVFTLLGITLDRSVLQRVTGLSRFVRDIGLASDAEARVPVSGKDEIGSLASEINRMLDGLNRSKTEMLFLAEHDPLTGLFNRRHFEEELQREIDEHLRLGVRGAVLWFDLDHFKDINDSLGHAAGDELLNAFGSHLQAQARAYCTVARLGGDEFGMLIPHAEGPEAVAAADRLIEGFSARTFLAGNHDLRISASAGVVLYPEHGGKTSELLARADIAMYDAKARGGNQVVAYTADHAWQNDMTERLEAAERILSAMRDDRLLLYAQPIQNFTGDAAPCFELLIRMRAENGDLVLPVDIISTAERLGLIRDIDRWVVQRAIRLLAMTQEEDSDIHFSINLSGCAFSDAALLDVIRNEFALTGASPHRLIIEITETTAIADIEGAGRFIETLKRIGCRFSLDDFGSGVSSYYYLKHLPIDFLKIDGSLVTGLAKDSADECFVNAIVEMCRGLHIQTVAEYVEDQQVLDAVSKTGVDFVQGFHVGMPEPLDFYLGDRFAESAHAWGYPPEPRAADRTP